MATYAREQNGSDLEPIDFDNIAHIVFADMGDVISKIDPNLSKPLIM